MWSSPTATSYIVLLNGVDDLRFCISTLHIWWARRPPAACRAGVGEVALSANQKRTAERLGRDYWLHVVYNCDGTPEVHSIQNPVRLSWEAVMAVEHYRIGAVELTDAAR